MVSAYTFWYQYRDASNYKSPSASVVVGEWTEDLKRRFMAVFGADDADFDSAGDAGLDFIPDQVSTLGVVELETLSFGGTYDDDSAWHELFWTLSSEPARNVYCTAEEWVAAFESALPWDPAAYDPNRRDVTITAEELAQLLLGKTVLLGCDERTFLTLAAPPHALAPKEGAA